MKKLLSIVLIAAVSLSYQSTTAHDTVINAPYCLAFINGFSTIVHLRNDQTLENRIKKTLKPTLVLAASNTMYQNTCARFLTKTQEPSEKRSIKLFIKKNMSDAYSIGKCYFAGCSFGIITRLISSKIS
jgi:hypothetical protein